VIFIALQNTIQEVSSV